MKQVFPIVFSLWATFALGSCTAEPSSGTENQSLNTSEANLPASKENVDLADYAQTLQGTWRRTSYPNGTLVFRGDQVLYGVGEGAAESPAFVYYQLADSCPTERDRMPAREAYDFMLVTGEANCEPIKLAGDRLLIFYLGSDEGVEYMREGDEG